jgi:hypothetical protein
MGVAQRNDGGTPNSTNRRMSWSAASCRPAPMEGRRSICLRRRESAANLSCHLRSPRHEARSALVSVVITAKVLIHSPGSQVLTVPPNPANATLRFLGTGHLAEAVLLQRADAGGTDGRAEAFNRAAHEFTCCWRPVWIPGSTGGCRWWFLWLVWLAGGDGPPIHHRIRRSDLS